MLKHLKSPATSTQIRHLDRLWIYVIAFVIVLFLLGPIFIIIPMSFSDSRFLEFPPRALSLKWYEEYISNPQWRRATMVSIQVAIMTTLLATPIGTAAAYAVRHFVPKSKVIVFGFIVAPMFVPLILLGIGLFFLFARLGVINTLPALAAAHTLLAVPVVMVLVAAGLSTYDLTQEAAARSLGASRFQAFRKVTLPQIRLSVISGALFAFLTSFDEVIVAMFISTGPQSTLTRRMFLQLRDQIDPTIAAICTILIVITVAIVLTTQSLQWRAQSGGRKPEQ